ncbi:MAG TPA: metallophosphoesterase [Polyangiaceae bacterium]|nr:metallophosphoesterase [Polyangiaceae bacterium]
MKHLDLSRRDFLSLASVGGVAFASALTGCARAAPAAPAVPGPPPSPPPLPSEDFFFLQLSDTHVGYRGDANPEAATTLDRAIGRINGLETKPDFVVFTGDLTQTTDDPAERRARMARFGESVARLGVKDVRFLPGEHDASLDAGTAFREAFGPTRWAFDHRGIHFVALDNVSDKAGALGKPQLDWLAADLARTPAETPVVVFTHRPLFDLYPSWEWATRDGADALAILDRRSQVTVFYGHIHQAHHHVTGRVRHHAGRSLVFPLPAPGSVPKKAPVPWDPSTPFAGLGSRLVETRGDDYPLLELPVERSSG